MIVLKICCSEWVNENRDKRELSVCKELGMDVVVLAKGNMKDKGRIDWVDGYEVRRYSTRPLGLHIPNSINRIISLFIWGRYARKIRADIISGHDLSGLTIGWISTWFVPKSKRPKLVYDSHEFEIGRTAKRSKFMIWAITHWERFMIKKSSMVMMVNDSIADEVQKIHKLTHRPVVVRNIPNQWKINEAECERIREEIINQLGRTLIGKNDFLLMYHGGVLEGRGVETLIRLVSINENVTAIVLGNGLTEYMARLKNLAKKLGVEKRVFFHPAVEIDALWKYVGAVDLGMILAPATCKNHYYSLPNKFFENIQCETPVICPNYPAMKKIVDKYRIGLTCDPTDIKAINVCVERMRTDKEFYESCKTNMKVAKEELCWEREKQVLVNEYRGIMA